MKRDNESTELNDNLFGLWERAHADAIERAPDGATWVVIGAIGSCTEMPSGPHPYPTHWHKPDREDDNAGWIPYRSRVYRCRLCRCEHTPSEEE